MGAAARAEERGALAASGWFGAVSPGLRHDILRVLAMGRLAQGKWCSGAASAPARCCSSPLPDRGKIPPLAG